MREDSVLNSRRLWLCCGLVSLLIGCSATVQPKRPDERVIQPAPRAVAKPGPTVPRADHCGPKLDPKVWKIQCAKADLAMMCRRSDPTDRRCAYKLSGKYRWTYGSYCDRALPCYKRACR